MQRKQVGLRCCYRSFFFALPLIACLPHLFPNETDQDLRLRREKWPGTRCDVPLQAARVAAGRRRRQRQASVSRCGSGMNTHPFTILSVALLSVLSLSLLVLMLLLPPSLPLHRFPALKQPPLPCVCLRVPDSSDPPLVLFALLAIAN